MIAPLLLGLACALGAQTAERLAPDGKPGLGADSTLGELLGFFRTPADEEVELLRELTGLEVRMGVLEAATERHYRDAGYFDLLDPRAEERLEVLHGLFTRLLEDPVEPLAKRDPLERVWGRLFLDARYRVRARLFDGWREDARTVSRGLLVLRGGTDGWVDLTEEDARNVATRVDLAAAFLRTRILDLGSLREQQGSPSLVPDSAVDELLSYARLSLGKERDELVAESSASTESAARRMRELLATERLDERAERWVRWRDAQDREAEADRKLARIWQPRSTEDDSTPEEIRRVRKTARRREAYRHAVDSLRHDPLDEEMCYTAATMARYVAGTREALSHYDRYLALRGIRLAEGRTWNRSDLTEEEEDAILFVQQIEYAGELPVGD